jgi:hypothetical protein
MPELLCCVYISELVKLVIETDSYFLGESSVLDVVPAIYYNILVTYLAINIVQ